MFKKHFSVLILVLCFWCLGFSQSVNSVMSNAYVPSKGFISIFNNHMFNTNGDYDIIYTNKGSNPGYVNFATNSSWIGANENSYIDGFVRVLHNDFFTFPVGDLGVYKPISITGGAGTSVAYFFEDVQENVLLNTSSETRYNSQGQFSPSTTEYWAIKGDTPTNLILHWDEDSALKNVVSNINDIKLIGWNGDSWEIIDSKVSEYVIEQDVSAKQYSNLKSNLSYGSLESVKVVPNDYKIITFGVANGSSDLELSSIDFNSSIANTEFIELTIFPNPINNLNNIKIDYNLINLKSKAHVVVFDNSGKLLLKEELKDLKGIHSLNYNEKTNQMYNIGIVTDNGTKKLSSVLVGSR